MEGKMKVEIHGIIKTKHFTVALNKKKNHPQTDYMLIPQFL